MLINIFNKKYTPSHLHGRFNGLCKKFPTYTKLISKWKYQDTIDIAKIVKATIINGKMTQTSNIDRGQRNIIK